MSRILFFKLLDLIEGVQVLKALTLRQLNTRPDPQGVCAS